MKKIFAIVLGAALMLAGTNAFAQLSAGAGWLNSTESEVYNNGDPQKTNLNGFYAGAQYNIPIVAGLGITPGLYVSMLFGKQAGSQGIVVGTLSGEAKYSELALNVPVNVNYAFEIGRDFKVFVYAGPVFQYGLMSKTVGNININIPGIGGGGTGDITGNNYTGVISDANGNTTNGDPVRNPFNIYVGGGAGIQAGNLQVIIGYDHSVTNISKLDKTTLGRSQIKLGVGYAF